MYIYPLKVISIYQTMFNKKFIQLLSLLLLWSQIGFSQNAEIKGVLSDTSSNIRVNNAVVLLLTAKDSILQSFTRSNSDGSFSLKNIPQGKAILMVMHPGYGDYVDDINITNNTIGAFPISLTSKSSLLEAVIIKTGGAIRIKGDTTIYTADSFKVSANANVEELLKKLPGIQVDKNGTIKAMGETVEKILVDGDEFFGDDPGMAVKNLRADAVKEVQVFDKKSEQAAFTGIDDGNTKKTINLKLKEDKKKGYFGKASAAGGISKDITNRFNNNLMIGSFKGKRKLSAFILNGNTGQDGLSWQDSEKYGANDGNSFEMMDEDGIFATSIQKGNADEEINVNTENGFIRNINAGLQYSNKWNDKTGINFSPKYNLQDYSNEKKTYTKTQLGDSTINANSTTLTNVNRYNIKNTFIYDLKLDTSNSLKLTIRENYYNTKSNEEIVSESTGDNSNLKNSSSRNANITSEKNAFTGNMIFKHRFKKSRRTLSINTDWSILNTDADNFLTSSNNIYEYATPLVVLVDQLTSTSKQSNNISSKILYTEPLSSRWSMEIAYELTYNAGINNQRTYIKSLSNQYDDAVDSLTNDFKQNILIHTPSTRFNYTYKKYKFNIGTGVGITQYDLLDRTISKDYKRAYTNLFPSASFVYSYKSNHALRVKYNGYNTQPTINQLQPLQNNTNIFDQYIGNPDLKPSFANNINITHNGYNFLKDQWHYQSVNVTFTENAITNNRIINPTTGSTVSQPINTNGNTSIAIWSGFGFKMKKSDIRANITGFGNVFKQADVINSFSSYSNSANTGLTIDLNKSKADKYDISINNTLSYIYNKNSQSSIVNQFKSNQLSLSATVYYKKSWSIITDYQFYSREKLQNEQANVNSQIWNLQLQKTFKSNEFTLFAKARDLLNQNIGIDRNFYGNVFTEERNQRLKRYFMIGFSWDFKNKNTSNKK